jgi:hypothetical protein
MQVVEGGMEVHDCVVYIIQYNGNHFWALLNILLYLLSTKKNAHRPTRYDYIHTWFEYKHKT